MSRHETAVDHLGRLPSSALSRSRSAVETVGFWGAVLAPLGYLPALALDHSLGLIAPLLVLNAACLIVWHRHRPSHDAGVLAVVARAGLLGGDQ